MKLLIVEDETMTREGLQKSLVWEDLGISGVFCAENGEIGLSMAKRISPEIVLTDIRMPRMDGITMAGRIREILPDCRFIFLSAYSEIEYYKAAIDLKAIRYLDKPVDTGQLREVLSEAVNECRQLSYYKTSREKQRVLDSMKLAADFCDDAASDSWTLRLKGLNVAVKTKGTHPFVTAVIVKVHSDFSDKHQDAHTELAAKLSEAAGTPNLFVVRRHNRIVLFLLTDELVRTQTLTIEKKLRAALREEKAIIILGKSLRGTENAHRAYSLAKTAELNAYCYSWGETVWYLENSPVLLSPATYAAERNELLAQIHDLRRTEALAAAQALYETLKKNKNMEYGRAQELYFECIAAVFHSAENLHLHMEEDAHDKNISWMERIESFILDELHTFLVKQLTLFFGAIDETRDEKRQILAIKDYIATHYSDDTLSIGGISSFLNMSASHICTMFKKETGDTINNYLTEYRLKRAQQYLAETLLSVSEISAKVGYKDNSYFGRLFRKRFGVTPNEYRNR